MNNLNTMSYKDKLNSLSYDEYLELLGFLFDLKCKKERSLNCFDVSDEFYPIFLDELNVLNSFMSKLEP